MKKTLIGATINEIDAVKVVLPKIDKKVVDEVIIVDGGSTDGTVEFCEKNGIFVLHQKGKGYGAALKQALEIAKGDIIIEFTPDGSSLLEDIPKLVAEMQKGYDFVIASRYKDGAKSYDDNIVTAFGNHMFTFLTNKLFGISYTDTLVGYRAYRKDAITKLNADSDGLSWPLQTAIHFAKKGFKVSEIPSDEPKRIGGHRKMRIFGTGREILFLIIREYIRMKRNKRYFQK